MSTIQEQTIPLYEEIVNGYNKLSVSGSTGRESGNLRRSRESAFDKFRMLGFPSIKNEDWKYTNITRFLKEGYTLDGPPARLTAVVEGRQVPTSGTAAFDPGDAARLHELTVKLLAAFTVRV